MTTTTNLITNTTQKLEINNQIVDWCVSQHVVHFNNAEIGLFVAVAFAYLLLIVEPLSSEFDSFAWFKGKGVMLARIILSVVLLVYLLFFKFRLIPLLIVQ